MEYIKWMNFCVAIHISSNLKGSEQYMINLEHRYFIGFFGFTDKPNLEEGEGEDADLL